MFEEFLADPDALDMFVTGDAGTGKTTSLAEYVKYCTDNEIPYVVCAHTHKACAILRSKLPPLSKVQTTHSFLGKRPTINTNAIKISEVNSSVKSSKTDSEPKVMFLDEFSMIGEKDLLDIRSAQDPEYCGVPILKLVAVGDLKQLPPVGDKQTLEPHGKYHKILKIQYRNDNKLQQVLGKLIAYIDKTEDPAPLQAIPGYFERGVDIDTVHFREEDKIYLAFTNRRVQELNHKHQGYQFPNKSDSVFSPTSQKYYTYVEELANVDYIDMHYTDPLHLGSKFKTLEGLIDAELCDFALFTNEEGESKVFAYVFGHYRYKVLKETLQRAAVDTNKAIEKEFKGYKAV
jgi:hypothetical protein